MCTIITALCNSITPSPPQQAFSLTPSHISQNQTYQSHDFESNGGPSADHAKFTLAAKVKPATFKEVYNFSPPTEVQAHSQTKRNRARPSMIIPRPLRSTHALMRSFLKRIGAQGHSGQESYAPSDCTRENHVVVLLRWLRILLDAHPDPKCPLLVALQMVLPLIHHHTINSTLETRALSREVTPLTDGLIVTLEPSSLRVVLTSSYS